MLTTRLDQIIALNAGYFSFCGLRQVSRLLPKLKAQNVRIEPGLTQLAAMAREDPDSLAAVANFKVSHRTYGSVQWREVVDVRGLDIDATVFFSKGSVEVSIICYIED